MRFPTTRSPTVCSPRLPPREPSREAPPPPPKSPGAVQNLGELALGPFLLLAVGFGLLALLTPCVFPLIPVTLAFFGARHLERKPADRNPADRTPADRDSRDRTTPSQPASSSSFALAFRSRWATLRLAFAFAAGIVVVYAGLGLVVTLIWGASGIAQLATHPWTNLGIAAAFFGFALYLLGLKAAWFGRLLPPNGIQHHIQRRFQDRIQRIDARARRLHGSAGVILMGVVFTATSFTCTMPFVGTLLVSAGQGTWQWPLLGMVVFALTFTLPFCLLALVPRALHWLRGRSGPWMIRLKAALGLIELLAALKFLSNADVLWGWGFFDRQLLLFCGAIVLMALVLLLLCGPPWPKNWRMNPTGIEKLAAIPAVLLCAYLLSGASGRTLDSYTEAYLPPPLPKQPQERIIAEDALTNDALTEDAVAALPWLPTLPQALRQAQAQGKPIFVDFTGYTCVNCRWMEKRIFAAPRVIAALREDFVLARLYTDGGTHAKANQTLQIDRFRTIALPFYARISPQNETLSTHVGIMRDPEAFLAWLKAR